MSAEAPAIAKPSDIGPETPHERLERAEIDRSVKWPVLICFGSAIFWLIVGSILAMISAIKMDIPSFLGTEAWLTFGRVRPAHLNTVIYGWSSLAGIGVGIWLMARLCRVKLISPNLIIAAGVIWNVGVLVGTVAILAGDSTSIEWLEFPSYAAIILFISYALISIWAVIMFRFRQPGHVYVSQWYLFGAFFWFPWLYATANILMLLDPVQGSVQGAVNWWYGHNVLGLWFTPIGLASAYYIIPKVIGKPVHSYYLSILGFWTLAFFYSWNGMHHLIGGPIPAWMISVSIVASVMMIIPVVTTAINHHMTLRGNFEALRYSPSLRFTVFGAMCYTVVSLQGCTMAIRSLNAVTHFTQYTIGHSHLGLYGFYSMIMFGAIYYIVPRLVQWEWPSASLIRWHFWLCAVGVLLMVSSLTMGGLIQGLGLADDKVPFMVVVNTLKPFLWARSASGIMMTVGHVLFAISFVLILFRAGGRRQGPTLFAPVEKPQPELPQL